MAKKLFKNLSKSKKIELYLLEKGYKKVESKSSKYTVLEKEERFYFLGKSATIRINNKNKVQGSFSCTGKLDKVLDSWSEIQNQDQWIEL